MKQFPHTAETMITCDAVSPDQLLHDVIVQTPQPAARANGIAVGIFDGVDEDGGALVSIPTFGLSRIRARSISPLDLNQIGQSLALGFEAGEPTRPIILGVMLTTPAIPTLAPADVLLDGKKLVLTAEHEIELRCGDAALILSADGRIQLRGTYITSHASATQRILGGSVNIN
ncbi:DUF6484 domain-containing protein [Massilia pseudoviolaceinigra]|uniref:DUF6484 domain-containing protein n=1 Tax=Massilia pseudoviolaceinigra TaxID=3057165 RepID=UPI0027965399|nr:DUF6484 domain-containing protein [Massilia sp. CCM 9206]MDQ1918744.1 DUF6484 domain-containing protein [Massilia sp. CCM 9206]